MPSLIEFNPRLYQQTIVASALKQNTLVVLPTGLGKTGVALMMAIKRLKDYSESKVLILAPTRPLVHQHLETFEKHADVANMVVMTGQIAPAKRAELFADNQVIFSTPQGFENDIISRRISLKDVSLIVFDEAHRASGDYSYVWLAREYMESAEHPLILALTASPGGDSEKIKEVCANLHIDHVEYRSQHSSDVQPYVQKTDVTWIEVQMDDFFKSTLVLLRKPLEEKLLMLQKEGLLKGKRLNMIGRRDILMTQGRLQGMLAKENYAPEILSSLSVCAQAMKLMHAVELLETQGPVPLRLYLDDIFKQARTTKTKATRVVAEDQYVKAVFHKLKEHDEVEHPKLIKLLQIVKAKVAGVPGAKVIVFNQFRDSISHIVEKLNGVDGIIAKEFVGQAKKKGSGLSQKEQIERLKEFSEGAFNVIVMSSVGEEGLDIPEVDLVVFYEPVPSAIRAIQRRGRTGRHAPGQVIMLVAKGTRDEAYRWSAYHKEKNVERAIKGVQAVRKESGQRALEMFTDGRNKRIAAGKEETVPIIVDVREKNRGIVDALRRAGANISLERLDAGDYVLSPEIGVEFKTTEDFAQSIVDKRLLEQLPRLKQAYPAPLIVVQGDDLYGVRNIHPHAIQGMLATIALSYRIPVLFTRNDEETAHLLLSMAKRGTIAGTGEAPLSPGVAPQGDDARQEALLASIPGIGPKMARKLLDRFKRIDAVVAASESEIASIDGIGPSKAQAIHGFLRREYKNNKIVPN